VLEAAYYRERRERFRRILDRISPKYAFELISPAHGEMWLRYQPVTTVSSRSLISAYAYALEDVMYCREDAELGYLMVLLMESDNHLLAFPPLGDYQPERFARALERMRHIFDLAGEPFRLAYMSGQEAEWVRAAPGYEVWTDPGENDYLYLISELTRFDGPENVSRRKGHNQFLRRHPAETQLIEPSHMADCARILEDWCAERECASCGFRCPRDIALRALKDLDKLHGAGGIMYADGEPEALMLLGGMGGGMVDMLSIFARHRYSGLSFCLIDQVCRLCAPDMTYLNSEEDMGIPSLRRFKESLHPALLLPKYRARADEGAPASMGVK
jgi:hypothetical protein